MHTCFPNTALKGLGLGLRRDADVTLTPCRELKKRQKERARQEQKAAKAAAAPAATQKVAAEGSSAAAEAEMDATVSRDLLTLSSSLLAAFSSQSRSGVFISYSRIVSTVLNVPFSGLPRTPIQDHQRPQADQEPGPLPAQVPRLAERPFVHQGVGSRGED